MPEGITACLAGEHIQAFAGVNVLGSFERDLTKVNILQGEIINVSSFLLGNLTIQTVRLSFTLSYTFTNYLQCIIFLLALL